MNHTRQARWGALLLALAVFCNACIEVHPLGAARPAPDAPADMPDLDASDSDQTPDAPIDAPDDSGELEEPDLTDMMPDLSHCFSPQGADMPEDMWGDMMAGMPAEDMAPSIPYKPCELGAMECDGFGGLRTCVNDERGCPVFGELEPCGPDRACVGGVCQCTNPCKQGDLRCVDNQNAEICLHGAGVCPTWAPSDTCEGATSCFLGQCACPNNCRLGETRCDGRELQRCAAIGNCRGWVTVRTCAPGSERCEAINDSSAQCVGCDIICSPGARFCNQGNVSRCELVGDNACPRAQPDSQCDRPWCGLGCFFSCKECGGCNYCP